VLVPLEIDLAARELLEPRDATLHSNVARSSAASSRSGHEV
jgi:hypothetical protein